MESGSVDFDRIETDESGQRLEAARQTEAGAHVGPVDLVGVEVGMSVPTGSIGTVMTREGGPPARWPRRRFDLQLEGDVEQPGAVGEIREIEAGAVPGCDHAGLEPPEEGIGAFEDHPLGAGEDPRPPVTAHGDRDDGGNRRVEPAG